MEMNSRGFTLRYSAQGDGVPLLLIHGFPLWGDRWREYGYCSELENEFLMLMPDLLGHGASDRPTYPSAYATPDLAQDCLRLLDHEGIDCAHVWGYSRGAWIAEAMAVSAPDRVKSLVFGGNILGLDPEFRAMVGTPLVEAARSRDWAQWPFPSTATEAAERQSHNDLAAIEAAASQFGSWSTRVSEVRDSGVPTMAYTGDSEWFLEAARDAAALAGAQFGTVPGDHAAAFEDGPAAAALVRSFLFEH